jgi:wyosine [tRNA(Phe)-imidazoG37] synthetase (radical SAM superfamily)
MERREFFDPEYIVDEVRRLLDEKITFDWLTFSGSGEPLLNSKFGYIASRLKDLVGDRIALLTNSTLLFFDEIRKEAGYCNLVLPSLDTAIEETFLFLNRPTEGITVKDVIRGLHLFKKEYPEVKMFLEVLFVRDVNDKEEELVELRRAIEYIEPDEIHLNTVTRPPSYKVDPVDYSFMLEAKNFLGFKNITIIGKFRGTSTDRLYEETLVESLRRRPLTLEGLAEVIGDRSIADELIKNLILKGAVEIISYGGKLFYRLKDS